MAQLLDTFGTATALTITLSGITNGAGRLASQVDNTTTKANKIFLTARIKSGGIAPTANTVYKFYLVRYDTHATAYASDGFGTSDAAVSTEPENSQLIGTIVVTATANKNFFGDFIILDPCPNWSIVFWNGSGQTISTTEADHFIHFTTVIVNTV